MTLVRNIAIAVVAVGALLLLLSLIPTHVTTPCRIAGHARTTVQECQ